MDRRWVDLDDVADVMKYSVIMSEDGQFCAHRGVDWAEMELVVDGALSGRTSQRCQHIDHADGEEPVLVEFTFLSS